MSDVMLCGILRMPPELWEDELSLMQIQSAAKEAATELERRADEIERLRAEIERLKGLCKAANQITRDREAEIERLKAQLWRAI